VKDRGQPAHEAYEAYEAALAREPRWDELPGRERGAWAAAEHATLAYRSPAARSRRMLAGSLAALVIVACSPGAPECGGRDSDPCPLGETCIAGQCTAQSWPVQPQALDVDAGAPR